MPPESLVVELFANSYVNLCMLPVVDYLQHRYFMVPSHMQSGQTTGDSSIQALIPLVELTLRRELAAA